MTDIKARKAELTQMLRTANALDEQGQHELADQLTRIAKAAVDKIEEDLDAEDAASPVDEGDPLAKGFGKSLVNLHAKLCRVCDANNCHKKLETLCGDKCDSDDLYVALRKACKLLGLVVG